MRPPCSPRKHLPIFPFLIRSDMLSEKVLPPSTKEMPGPRELQSTKYIRCCFRAPSCSATASMSSDGPDSKEVPESTIAEDVDVDTLELPTITPSNLTSQ